VRPPDDYIVETWKELMKKDEKFAPGPNGSKNAIFTTASNFICYWRNALAEGALAAVRAELQASGCETEDERAAQVEFWLGEDYEEGSGDVNRPYIYRDWEEDNPTESSAPFLHPLIIRTMAAHINELQALSPEERYEYMVTEGNFPLAGLLLSVMAVHRALESWLSGKEVIESGKAGSFSGANWGLLSKRREWSLVLHQLICDMSQDDWIEIIEEAEQMRKVIYKNSRSHNSEASHTASKERMSTLPKVIPLFGKKKKKKNP